MPNLEKSPLVSVIILTYNAEKYIKKCIDSVLAQAYPSIEIILIDNNSEDETKKILRTADCGLRTNRIIFNKNNVGFAAGQNQGIKESKGKYVLCLNQDAWLDKNFIKNAIGVLESDEKIAAIQGILLRYDFQNDKILDIIDTTGLVMLKNRRIINRGQGTKNSAQNSEGDCGLRTADCGLTKEIFGSDGAAPIYRREALEDVKLPKNPKNCGLRTADCGLFEYFDENFWMYKEDVDLAWRLRLAGWKSVYAPMCLAYHGRGAGDSAAKDYLNILKERRKISSMAKFYSWKNQRLMQIKNETIGTLFRHMRYILPKEIASWCYVLIFEEPYALKSIWQFFKEMPLALQKRKIIMLKKRASDKEMERWFL